MMAKNSDIEIEAFLSAVCLATSFFLSYSLCVAIVMYFDFSGKWSQYAMHKTKRSVTMKDYQRGFASLIPKFIFAFVPAITLCCYIQGQNLHNCSDTWYLSLIKLYVGNSLGIIWAGVVHFVLHLPPLYKYHKAHHGSAPQNMTASSYGEVSWVEYCILDIPLFAMSLLLFPTHFHLYVINFAWHGWDEASAHCAFAPPGWLSWFFDGDFHYHHHNNPLVNYSEFGLLDRLFGTHHTQSKQYMHNIKTK